MRMNHPERRSLHTFPWLALILFFSALSLPGRGFAQDAPPDGPVYVVQEGDTLWSVAVQFGISLDELTTYNQIKDPNQVGIGTRLVIPGLPGVNGELKTEVVGFGEDLLSLSRKYQVSEVDLAKLNHLTSPGELYVGRSLILPVQENIELPGDRSGLAEGQTVLELAVLKARNPWEIALLNELRGPATVLPGDVLRLPGVDTSGPAGLPGEINDLTLTPTPLVQGKSAVLQLTGGEGLTVTGTLLDHAFEFVPLENGVYNAILGVHAMTAPGLYPLAIQGALANGAGFSFTQSIYIRSGGYPMDPVLIVSPETVDPAVTRPEDAQWNALTQPVTLQKQWQGLFVVPVPKEFAECWPSQYGNRRSYNGSPYNYFHTGLDFCGGVGTEIYAPAAGTVVFAGPLTVRGNATMIDHGWGVYTGYMHQSEIKVSVGDQVVAGELIGLVGNTGRVTGPHLHFEIWAGGVQVDPMDWLDQEFP